MTIDKNWDLIGTNISNKWKVQYAPICSNITVFWFNLPRYNIPFSRTIIATLKGTVMV